jgi:hypothetical protein
VGIGLNGKGYVGTGAPVSGGSDGGFPDWWQYDPAADAWTQKADLPVFNGRWGAVAFANESGGKAYVATGIEFPYMSAKNDCFEYDPLTDSWAAMPSLPSGAAGRCYAVGMSIPQGGVIGTGYSGYNYNDFYEFSFASKSWGKMIAIPGERFLAQGFAIGNTIYVGGGLYGLGDNEKTVLDDFRSLYW